VTACVLFLVGGILEERRGLLAIAALGGAAIGLLAANAAASPDGVTPSPMTRRQVTRLAIGLAVATVTAAALGIWLHARLEGGVMDPLSYLWATLGLYVPAQAVIAAVAAAWGAGSGPIRWRG
jgi:hypothetical protein